MNLRDYQISISLKAAQMLDELGIVYLALQTRTGKTLTAMEICRINKYSNVLFVTKKKAISSIEADYRHYADHFNITIINYESVSKVQGPFDVAIIDEGHSLGTYPKPSKRYKDLKRITFSIPCILMSATPSPESYSQLYHQFTINKYHSWNKSKNFYHWAKYYVNKQVKYLYGREVPDYSDAKVELVKHATDKYFLTLSQTEAGIEQQITEQILHCDMSDKTQEMINKLRIDKVIEVNGSAILADTAVKEMSKVQQLSSGSVKLEDGSVLIVDKSKAEFIKQYFKGQRIVVFYKFIGELQILTEVFDSWTSNPDEFQSGRVSVFFGQFLSSREGIRLDTADAIVFFNIDFAFLSYEQSKNRIVSKERTKTAKLYWVFNRRGIEQQIYNVVRKKEDYTVNYYRKW
jgi:hypothetical protein